MLLSRNIYSLTREMYLAGCELHIQTLTFLIVLTLKKYVNAKTIFEQEYLKQLDNDIACYNVVTYSHKSKQRMSGHRLGCFHF